MYQVSAWKETFDILTDNVVKQVGINNYPPPNKALEGKEFSMLRVEPLKWWVYGTRLKNIDINQGTYLDISHSRTQIRINGKNSVDLLNLHLPIDLKEKSFPTNSVANTTFHHAGVTLWKSSYGYELFLPRAYSLSLWEVLIESSEQFGYEIT